MIFREFRNIVLNMTTVELNIKIHEILFNNEGSCLNYATKIEDAWRIVEYMKEYDIFSGALQIYGSTGVDYIDDCPCYTVHFGHDTSESLGLTTGNGFTVQEAICRCAILTIVKQRDYQDEAYV